MTQVSVKSVYYLHLGDFRRDASVTAVEIEQLARFDEHWRVLLAGDNRLLAQALAKRGFLDVLKRRVPLYRLSDLGREALAEAGEE